MGKYPDYYSKLYQHYNSITIFFYGMNTERTPTEIFFHNSFYQDPQIANYLFMSKIEIVCKQKKFQKTGLAAAFQKRFFNHFL